MVNSSSQLLIYSSKLTFTDLKKKKSKSVFIPLHYYFIYLFIFLFFKWLLQFFLLLLF